MSYTMAMGPGFHGHEVLTEEALESIKRWEGQTVPLRGPNRELLGEAKITSVDVYGDSNVVHVSFEAKHDPGYSGVSNLAKIITGRNGMSFKPQREDDVARWLKRVRARWAHEGSNTYWAIDEILDEYRARADYGLSLDADMSELPEGY